jgi:hypothetical protein
MGSITLAASSLPPVLSRCCRKLSNMPKTRAGVFSNSQPLFDSKCLRTWADREARDGDCVGNQLRSLDNDRLRRRERRATHPVSELT